MDWRIDQTIDVGSKRFFSDMLTRIMVHSGVKIMEELIQKYEREPDPEFTALTIPDEVAELAYNVNIQGSKTWNQVFEWWEEWFRTRTTWTTKPSYACTPIQHID